MRKLFFLFIALVTCNITYAGISVGSEARMEYDRIHFKVFLIGHEEGLNEVDYVVYNLEPTFALKNPRVRRSMENQNFAYCLYGRDGLYIKVEIHFIGSDYPLVINYQLSTLSSHQSKSPIICPQ